MATSSTSSSGIGASLTGPRSTSPTPPSSAGPSASSCSACWTEKSPGRSAPCARSAYNAPMDIVLANPRGFCAGVDRAIEIVKRALDSLGAPIYVRHEVVHNRYVVAELKHRGAVFAEELEIGRPSGREGGGQDG